MATLVLEDVLTKTVTVTQDNSYTLQHFDYKCERQRGHVGNPFGTDTPSMLHFTLRVADNDPEKELLDRMQQAETFSYSFIFDMGGKLTIVAYGYIVEMEEVHASIPVEKGVEEQMLINCTLLLSHLLYEGSDGKTLKLTISND